ncbi:MAG: DNA-3-methyladenine glycosylase 2 family protein [Solirubrobacterales bacterium]|nr:DNA-3-methyladenine glycosylase 2 family protein [Solirubrobacterales bacterium]MBV9940682.1 DNA-3-methyladenine glycosylase 2 family protein [Solirubrobacterales bacterium]
MTVATADPDSVRGRQIVYDALAALDDVLARLMRRRGRPDPLSWDVLEDVAGEDAFAELALHIVSQQISTAAAVTIFKHLRDTLGGTLQPVAMVAVSADSVRTVGLSRAKARSLRDLADRVLDGRLSFERLARSDDATAQAELEEVRGVGPWSAQMFLLHNLRRPDIFPAADIGLLRAAQSAFGLPQRPTPAELSTRAERWRPYRSYACALLWAHGSAHSASPNNR